MASSTMLFIPPSESSGVKKTQPRGTGSVLGAAPPAFPSSVALFIQIQILTTTRGGRDGSGGRGAGEDPRCHARKPRAQATTEQYTEEREEQRD